MSEAAAPINQFTSTWMNFIGGFLAIAVTLIVAAQTLLPYFVVVPESSQAAIGQQQTMFQTVFIMIASFFFGASVANRTKDATISTLSSTAAKAQDALAPVLGAATSTVTLKPEEKVVVKAEPDAEK